MYFLFYISLDYTNHTNILTLKISISSVNTIMFIIGYEGNGMTDRDEKACVMKVFLEHCKTFYPRECPVYDGRSIMYTKLPLNAASPFIKHEIEWRDPEDGRNGLTRKAHVILKLSNK